MSVDPVNSAPVDAGGAIQDGDEAEFQIDTWAAKHSLTQKTVKVLRKEYLTSQDALCLLDNDDINSLGLFVAWAAENLQKIFGISIRLILLFHNYRWEHTH